MSQVSPTVVGMQPWLPWSWWTEPVRAERLALLRIGVAVCLIADILIFYAPHTLTFFGKGNLGDSAVFDWNFRAPRMNWSLLRGVSDASVLYLALFLWIAMTLWILGTSLVRVLFIHANPPPDDRAGIALHLWIFGFVIYTTGLWADMTKAGAKTDLFAWLVPLVGLTIACLFCVLDLLLRIRDTSHRIPWLTLGLAFGAMGALLFGGVIISETVEFDEKTWWIRLWRPWQDDETLLTVMMGLWIGSAVFLLIGWTTRLAAMITWMMSMSFANANPYLDNAGDTIRLILLFYLMLCPCGAVWSIDAWWKKQPRPIYVHPWPIRLLFVQMIVMYSFNGLYKIVGMSWLEGSSLHYVLGDLVLTRFSSSLLPLPIELTRWMTWSVMIWEASFPLMVLWKWPRRIALVFGVMFHVGIFLTMELGPFVPYALCMYLPLIPWEGKRGEGEKGRKGDGEKGSVAG